MHKADIRATRGNNNRILLIEDDNSIRTIISKVLSFMGYHVATAGSGEEGLNLFLNGAFDLVVTDFNMSGMDGFALSSHIKEKSPDTPIILITGSEKDTIRKRLKTGHFFDLKALSRMEAPMFFHDLPENHQLLDILCSLPQ